MKKITALCCCLALFPLAARVQKAHAQETSGGALLAETLTAPQLSAVLEEAPSLTRDRFGDARETFLMLVLKYSRPLEVVRLCLDAGCSVKAVSADGRTALHYAALYAEDGAVIDAIVEARVSEEHARERYILLPDDEGETSFDLARENASPAAYEALLRYAADPDPRDAIAAELPDAPPAGDESVAEPPGADTAEEPDVEERQEDRRLSVEEAFEALNEAGSSSQENRSEYLMDYAAQGATESEIGAAESEAERTPPPDPNAQDARGVTPLMRAARSGNDVALEELLARGADVNLRDSEGWTALMYAVRWQNNLGIVNTLIESGAHVRVRNNYNVTPLLMAAAYSGNAGIVARLLHDRAPTDEEVMRAFVFALTARDEDPYVTRAKVREFLNIGVPLNALWEGQTPLMYAAQYATSTALIRDLLDAGSDPLITTGDGKTAFDFAKENPALEHDDVYWVLNGAL